MKIAFISDIHGNAVALEAVLRDIEKKHAEKIVVLGDICYRGPEPKRALELVRSLQTDVIKGNADEWVVRGIHDTEVPSAALNIMRTERMWTLKQLEEEDIAYLANLPETLLVKNGERNVFCFHATPDSLFDIILPTAEIEQLEKKVFQVEEADIYVYGHIHTPYTRFLQGRAIVNIGSVGLPFDGMNLASYALVEIDKSDIHICIQRVAYDYERVIRQYSDLEYPNKEWMSEIIRTGQLKR